MECRKDTAKLLNATVTKDLDEGYSSLLCSRLIAVPYFEKVQAVIISKHAIGMRARKGENGKNVLHYEVGNYTFVTTAEDKLTLTGDECTIMLDIQKLNVFMMGDLAFYADCPWQS
jgi:hypothetical protein